jgi:drug/metabolite transporter (DMT)-like permease
MQTIARAFAEGGIFMYLILVAGLLHAIPVLAQFIACKKADFSPYLWGGLAGILLLGVLGSVVGMIQAFEAISMVAPEQKAAMMAMGASIALNTTAFSVLMVLPGVFFTGIAASLARNLAPRRMRAPS